VIVAVQVSVPFTPKPPVVEFTTIHVPAVTTAVESLIAAALTNELVDNKTNPIIEIEERTFLKFFIYGKFN